MENSLNFLDKHKILCHLLSPAKELLNELLIFETLDSTNDFLLSESKHFTGNIACLAEQQSKGKGRNGRSWISPLSKNIYFSLLWRFSKDLNELSGLSLITAIAVAKILKQYPIKNPIGLKWPNDILCDFKKLAGILIELKPENHSSVLAVIGIGINVAMPKKWSQDITQPFTDLEEITEQTIDPNELAGKLVNELIKALSYFEDHGLQAFMSEFEALDLTRDRNLNIFTNQENVKGIGRGINSQGHLLVETTNNQIQSFAQGEVSIQVANLSNSTLN